jgi:GAF domain-containing protein
MNAGGADLQRRLAELEAENARLRGRLADERLGEDLRRAVTESGAAAALAAPARQNEILDQIVTTAAYVLRAHAASLFLIDEVAGELVFEVALGEKAAEVKKFRLPLGQGIAGFVAATGQALAVSDVQRDRRWAREIGQAVEYTPQVMLAVPLIAGDGAIGVLELLDKDGGAPFGMEDMQTAGHFAALAAAAIQLARAGSEVSAILGGALARLGDAATGLTRQAEDASRRTASGDQFRDVRRMADVLAEVGRRGDAERRLALSLVEALGEYVRARGEA